VEVELVHHLRRLAPGFAERQAELQLHHSPALPTKTSRRGRSAIRTIAFATLSGD